GWGEGAGSASRSGARPPAAPAGAPAVSSRRASGARRAAASPMATPPSVASASPAIRARGRTRATERTAPTRSAPPPIASAVVRGEDGRATVSPEVAPLYHAGCRPRRRSVRGFHARGGGGNAPPASDRDAPPLRGSHRPPFPVLADHAHGLDPQERRVVDREQQALDLELAPAQRAHDVLEAVRHQRDVAGGGGEHQRA